MSGEEWRLVVIDGQEWPYEVSNRCRVRRDCHVMSPHKGVVAMSHNGKRISRSVSKLTEETFGIEVERPGRKDPWTAEDENFLRDNFSDLTDQEIAERIGRSRRAVASKRSKMGLSKNRWGPGQPEWGDDEIEELVRRRGLVSLHRLVELTGYALPYLQQRMREVTRTTLVQALRFTAGRQTESNDLFRGLLMQQSGTQFYVDEARAAERIIQTLDLDVDLPKGLKVSLTHHLRCILPKSMFERVHRAYSGLR